MTGFRVEPETLTEFAREIEQREPFSELSVAARGMTIPSSGVASSLAIERFVDRLAQELIVLATATGSLGRATRSAAAGYQQVDDSVRSVSTS